MVTKMAASSSERLQSSVTRPSENNSSSGLHGSNSSSASDVSEVAGSGGVTAQSIGAAERLVSLLSVFNLSAAKSALRTPHRDADEKDGNKRVKLDVEQLRDCVFSGGCCYESDATAESASTRPIAWRILLGVLDENPAQWPELLAEKRRTYQDWKREFLGCRRQSVVGKQPRHDTQSGTASPSHLIDTPKDAYDQDIALMKEIDKVLCLIIRLSTSRV